MHRCQPSLWQPSLWQPSLWQPSLWQPSLWQPSLWPLLLLGCCLFACHAAPEHDDPSVAAQVRRVLGSDLSGPGFAARAAGLERAQAGLRAEFGRLDRWSESPSQLARSQHTAATAPQRLQDGLAAERERLGRLSDTATRLLPTPDTAVGDLAHGLDTTPEALRLDRPPLDEPEDRAHRTHPDDMRPEAPLWPRFWRRLPF
jgi:hypothetical protein